jgi:hypothetical protein
MAIIHHFFPTVRKKMMCFHMHADDGEIDDDIQQRDDINRAAENSNKSSRFVTVREYYCFMMQVRKGLFNIVLFGGRLFQQWAVDMYIKIESMRLDWYSNPANQKLIRAELYQVSKIKSVNISLTIDNSYFADYANISCVWHRAW